MVALQSDLGLPWCASGWDTNDNAPEFVQPLYKVQLCEDSPVGALWLSLSQLEI